MAACLPLLCLPPAGASASMYARWRRGLPDWIEVVPVELPGRGPRFGQPFAEDFEALVEQLCAEHRSHLSGPHALFGHSMGALLAYAIAVRQRAAGARPALALLASASPAPALRDPASLAARRDDASLTQDLREQGGTPEEVFMHEEMLRITLDVLAADYRICAGYRHRRVAPLPMPVHVFAGRDDDIASERIEAWRAEAAGRFSVRWFDGGHFFVRQHQAEVLQAVADHLAQAWSPAAQPAAQCCA